MSENEKIIRTKTGVVVSDKMDKTIVVMIERKVKDRFYKKYIKRSTKLKVHDSENTSRMGDLVKIREGRPMSKHKSWYLVEVLERAEG